MRSILVLGLVSLGCAHSPPATEAELAAAYRVVRGGAHPSSRAGKLSFCSTSEGLVVSHAVATGPDDWATCISNWRVSDDVRGLLASDPVLRGDDVRARNDDGQIVLTGRVASDDHALHAIDRVLSVAGVVSVNADLRSPESPGAPRTSERVYCE